jgi:hypothetical protein
MLASASLHRGHKDTSGIDLPSRRTRRRHAPELRERSSQALSSDRAVPALAGDQPATSAPPAFPPLALPALAVPSSADEIRNELQLGANPIKVACPACRGGRRCGMATRVAAVIRVDAVWMAAQPLDMRLSAEATLSRVVGG